MILASRAIVFVLCIAISTLVKAPSVLARPAEAFRSVQFIYVVPSNKELRIPFQRAIEFAAFDIQSWLATSLNGYTFELASPPVKVVRSDKTDGWFTGNVLETSADSFYKNVSTHLIKAGVVQFNDPTRRYVVYVDADHKCGQSGAGGNGVAVMSANDLRGLSGDPIIPACGTANSAEVQRKCRWVGGSAHELLHTFGLSHYNKLDACKSNECQRNALMMFGYLRYPDAALLETEVQQILNSSFFSKKLVLPKYQTCG